VTSRTERYLDEQSAAARAEIAERAERTASRALTACEKAAVDRPLAALGVAASAGALLAASLRRAGGSSALRSALRLRHLLRSS